MQIMTKNNNRERIIRKKRKQKTHQGFTCFGLKPTSTGEDKEELSLFLKRLQLFKLSNPKALIYTQKETYYFGQKSLPIFFPNYKGSFYIRNKVHNCQRYLFLNRISYNRIFPIIIGNPLSIISSIKKLSITFQIDSKYNLRHFPTMTRFSIAFQSL